MIRLELAQVAQIWFSILLTVFVLSFLHSENPLYRLAEHIFIGAAAGHFAVMGIASIKIGLTPLQAGNILYVIPMILGLLMFTTFSRRQYWLSRFPIALIVGTGVGLSLRTVPQANVLQQISPSITLLGKDPFATFNNIILFVALLTSMTYFIFTRELRGPLGNIAKAGRYFMLIAFGGSYGGTVLTRLATLVPTMQTLLSPDSLIATGLGCLLVLGVLGYSYRRAKSK